MFILNKSSIEEGISKALPLVSKIFNEDLDHIKLKEDIETSYETILKRNILMGDIGLEFISKAKTSKFFYPDYTKESHALVMAFFDSILDAGNYSREVLLTVCLSIFNRDIYVSRKMYGEYNNIQVENISIGFPVLVTMAILSGNKKLYYGNFSEVLRPRFISKYNISRNLKVYLVEKDFITDEALALNLLTCQSVLDNPTNLDIMTMQQFTLTNSTNIGIIGKIVYNSDFIDFDNVRYEIKDILFSNYKYAVVNGFNSTDNNEFINSLAVFFTSQCRVNDSEDWIQKKINLLNTSTQSMEDYTMREEIPKLYPRMNDTGRSSKYNTMLVIGTRSYSLNLKTLYGHILGLYSHLKFTYFSNKEIQSYLHNNISIPSLKFLKSRIENFLYDPDCDAGVTKSNILVIEEVSDGSRYSYTNLHTHIKENTTLDHVTYRLIAEAKMQTYSHSVSTTCIIPREYSFTPETNNYFLDSLHNVTGNTVLHTTTTTDFLSKYLIENGTYDKLLNMFNVSYNSNPLVNKKFDINVLNEYQYMANSLSSSLTMPILLDVINSILPLFDISNSHYTRYNGNLYLQSLIPEKMLQKMLLSNTYYFSSNFDTKDMKEDLLYMSITSLNLLRNAGTNIDTATFGHVDGRTSFERVKRINSLKLLLLASISMLYRQVLLSHLYTHIVTSEADIYLCNIFPSKEKYTGNLSNDSLVTDWNLLVQNTTVLYTGINPVAIDVIRTTLEFFKDENLTKAHKPLSNYVNHILTSKVTDGFEDILVHCIPHVSRKKISNLLTKIQATYDTYLRSDDEDK